MNKRKGILDTMNKADKRTQILLEVIYRYYKIYDLDFNAVHSKVFYELYMSDEKPNFETICRRVGISLTTLKMYRKQFDILAVRLLENGVN